MPLWIAVAVLLAVLLVVAMVRRRRPPLSQREAAKLAGQKASADCSAKLDGAAGVLKSRGPVVGRTATPPATAVNPGETLEGRPTD